MKTYLQHTSLKYVAIVLGALVSTFFGYLVVSAQTAIVRYDQLTAESIGSVDVAVIEANSMTAQRIRVAGWALNRANKQAVTTVRVTNDFAGQDVVDMFVPGIARSDVSSVFPNTSEKPGFHWRAPSRYYDGADHTLYFFAGDASKDTWDYIGGVVLPRVDSGVVGSLDLINFVAGKNVIVGWAMDLDDLWLETSQVPVAVYLDGDFVAAGVADSSRPDVEQAYMSKITGVGAAHGYAVSVAANQIPGTMKDDKSHRLEVFALEVSEGTMQSIGVKWPVIKADGKMMY